ncbi:hypothetical protein ACLVWU_01430 [Bdellovibrio sp. HCB290]|uniref:hypothetical protein n=1 Tax=Bdellovibrio sp. HCB290 TaxID=3394356 RepID=UPI0039B50904
MKRRQFLSSSLVAGATLLMSESLLAETGSTLAAPNTCLPDLSVVTAEATYFSVYEHFHLLSIPVAMLVAPPADGYTTRTSPLDKESLDVVAFEKFLKETGLPEALRTHSHEVKFTQKDLLRIGDGEKDVEIVVMTPKGNLAHRFYFTATKSALVKVKRARSKQG